MAKPTTTCECCQESPAIGALQIWSRDPDGNPAELADEIKACAACLRGPYRVRKYDMTGLTLEVA